MLYMTSLGQQLPHVLGQVHVVASMPCYSPINVYQQRGQGVFDCSIKGLQILNAVGYGKPDTGLQLDLVYNPNGIFLAPPQAKLEVVPQTLFLMRKVCQAKSEVYSTKNIVCEPGL